MVAPKGAISNPFAGTGDYASMVEGVRFPGEDPKASAEGNKKDNERMNAMLKAQNGDVPAPPAPAPAPAPQPKAVFTPELKKEMLSIVTENKLDIVEVTDQKIVFAQGDNKFVILPL